MNETIKRIDDQAKLVFKKKSYGYEAKEVRLPSDKYNMLIELAMKLQDENETLSAANNDLLHEIRVLKNQINDQTNLRILEFKVQNKQLLKQNKRYCEALEFYADHQNLIDANDNPYFNITEVARKALEGEK